MSQNDDNKLTYSDAGVNIDLGNALVDRIKQDVKKTKRSEILSDLGSFGALCSIPSKYTKPLLVSATDGVGTKLKLAIDTGKHETIGQDLVAMCVNDLIVQGAEPLFFLDYYATSKLDIDVASTVIKGIADGCILAGCSLIGGETAEMPGIYQKGDYDLAGFAVGVVEEEKLITSNKVKPDDVIIGLSSSGPHSNGYSLIRKILEINNIDLDKEKLDDKLLIEHLLAPTKIYVKTILKLIKTIDVSSIAHITGGGFWENIPRVLPGSVSAVINKDSWQWPNIFKWLQEKGNISTHEMYRTFNCGIGMIITVPSEQAETALAILEDSNETAFILGKIVSNTKEQQEKVIIE